MESFSPSQNHPEPQGYYICIRASGDRSPRSHLVATDVNDLYKQSIMDTAVTGAEENVFLPPPRYLCMMHSMQYVGNSNACVSKVSK